MIFQTSKNANDLKAFKWLIKDGKLIYQDDRSIHEVKPPDQFEFQGQKTTLEDGGLGKFRQILNWERVLLRDLHGTFRFRLKTIPDRAKGFTVKNEPNLIHR